MKNNLAAIFISVYLLLSCTPTQAISLNGGGASNQDSARFIRMQLYKDDITKDETIIFLKNKANPAYDLATDGVYMQGLGQVRLFSYSSDNVPLAFNFEPLPIKSTAVNLNVFAKTDGRYQLRLTEINNVPPLFDIWLMDNYLKDSLDIRYNLTYTFNISKADTNSFGGRRFTVVVRQSPPRACHLLSFSTDKIANTNQVQTQWATENEHDYTNYMIERSTDNGKNFVPIDSLASNSTGTYGLPDKKPAASVNFYRLKQQDINGTISYSAVARVDLSPQIKTKAVSGYTPNIYPNPVADVVNIVVADHGTNNYNISITNISGFQVKQTKAQTSSIWQSQVGDLKPGIYLVKVVDNKDQSVIGLAKFMKK